MQLTLPQAKTLQQIANVVSAQLVGDSALGDTPIFTVASIETAGPGSITFLANDRYKKYLQTTRASAVIIEDQYAALCPVTTLVTKNPRLSLARLLQLCNAETKPKDNDIHSTAVIAASATLGNNVRIGAGVVVGEDCVLGDNTILHPNVTLYPRVSLGRQCIVHSGVVLGSDGFGFAVDADGSWVKLPHMGGLQVGDNVEIGSNTTVDRGLLDDTKIADNVIIDNLVQIAHNVTIGSGTAIAGCVGIAGSTNIGSGCLIGGAANIGGHIDICDGVHITGTSSVNSSINKPGVYSSGLPARENGMWRRNVARFMSLDNMAKRLRQVEKSIETN